MVCGPKRMNLGTHPLNTHPRPSFLYILASKLTKPSFSFALITLVLITSTGLQMVVATKPAKKLAVK